MLNLLGIFPEGFLMPSNRRNLSILFFTMVVVMLGFGLIIPIMPFYIESFGAGGSALGLLMATYGVMQFLFAPVWGSLSDYYGRKPILLIGVLGNALAQIFMGFSTELWMLFAARAIAGVLSAATLPTAMAYIGDSTSRENRGGGMGMIGAAMGIGMVLGPGIGGWLAGSSLSVPFFLAGVLSFVAFLLIMLILPESLQEKAATPQITGPQLGVLWQALLGPLGILFILAFLLAFGLTNFEGVFGLYASRKYGYGPQDVGTILTMIGIISAVIQGFLIGPLTRRFGEVIIIRLAFLNTAIGFILMILAQTDLQVWLTVCYFVIGHAMLTPSVSSLISKRATGGQGIAMGLNNSFMSLGRIVGPVWAGFAFDSGINLPYLTGGVIMLVGFYISATKLSQSVEPRTVNETQGQVAQ
jgi:DHA1 family multidrug resistance protein-like MFS transporter